MTRVLHFDNRLGCHRASGPPRSAVAPVGRYGLVANKIERIDADKIMPELLDFELACVWRGRRFMCSFALREKPLKEARHDCAP